jgi:predicted XRE-type DNA-binding protein
MNDIDTSITHITPKGGNIFEDLGFEPREAAKLKIKAQLMCQISEWIKEKQLKQEEASRRLS